MLYNLSSTAGDHVMQPFEPELDWSAFSVPVAEQDIPVLHEKLAEVEAQPGAVAAMQQALHCATQHMIYTSITGGFLGEQGERHSGAVGCRCIALLAATAASLQTRARNLTPPSGKETCDTSKSDCLVNVN